MNTTQVWENEILVERMLFACASCGQQSEGAKVLRTSPEALADWRQANLNSMLTLGDKTVLVLSMVIALVFGVEFWTLTDNILLSVIVSLVPLLVFHYFDNLRLTRRK